MRTTGSKHGDHHHVPVRRDGQARHHALVPDGQHRERHEGGREDLSGLHELQREERQRGVHLSKAVPMIDWYNTLAFAIVIVCVILILLGRTNSKGGDL